MYDEPILALEWMEEASFRVESGENEEVNKEQVGIGDMI